MQQSPLLTSLVEALRCLPGVGLKSAQRMAFYLLSKDRQGGKYLSHQLAAAMENIGHCSRCRTFTEQEICTLCTNPKRDTHQLCVVETPADVSALEQATQYGGRYFVLMGHLSPLDGIGPKELGLDKLETRLDEANVNELILATNTTVEGEATSYYISELAKARDIKVMRIAQGVPVGGELEYLDGGTLSHAFSARREV